MSLVVYPYRRSEDGKVIDLWPGETGAGRTLAGFESLRNEFYGSEEVARFGCRLLGRLRDGDIHAEGADLDELRQEVELMLAKMSEIIPRLSFANQTAAGMPQPSWKDYLSERLRNILEAIKAAKLHPGGRGGIAIS